MLSILIPFKNYDLNALCNELLSQINNDNLTAEIIICDDSSDLFLKENSVLKQKNDIIFLENQTNLGRTKTRQKLAQEATYDWILFLDADMMPVHKDYIFKYLVSIQNHPTTDLFFGGVQYEHTKPKKEKILRWVYGKKREAKTQEYREIKTPSAIFSSNTLYKKEAFLEINIFTENYYGLDNIISNVIKQQNKQVLHIDNNAYHLGLESSKEYICKVEKSIQTLFDFEQRGVIKNNDFKIQKIYLQLKKLYLINLINLLYKTTKPLIFSNLSSYYPILFLLDFYKLNIYIALKKNE